MEFLDINLAKDSMPFTVPFTGGFQRKPYSSLVLKIPPYKKFAKQENLSLFMNSIVWNGKMRVETRQKL
jgi:hypothetical protein